MKNTLEERIKSELVFLTDDDDVDLCVNDEVEGYLVFGIDESETKLIHLDIDSADDYTHPKDIYGKEQEISDDTVVVFDYNYTTLGTMTESEWNSIYCSPDDPWWPGEDAIVEVYKTKTYITTYGVLKKNPLEVRKPTLEELNDKNPSEELKEFLKSDPHIWTYVIPKVHEEKALEFIKKLFNI